MKGNPRVLVVDDIEANRQAVRAILSPLGIETVQASSGDEALGVLVDDQDFAVILLDVKMEGIDGFETARLIHGNGDTAGIPIIFMTAYEKNQSRESRAYENGAIDYLYKPMDRSIVVHKVRIFIDLHQKKKELEEARRAAEAANEAKTHFLQIMAHDLRTPLFTVLSYAEFVKEEMNQSGVEKALIKDMDAVMFAAKSLINITDDFLDSEKIASGDHSLDCAEFSLDQLLDDLYLLLKPQVERKKNEFHIRKEGDSGLMIADRKKLGRVLTNLVGNAAKFTEKGRITISVQSVEKEGLEWIVFTVTDTGKGMNKEQLERIFNKFTQADSATYSQHGGTGLGLAIVRQFTELQEGTVEVSSTPGQGTSFTVTLPRQVRNGIKGVA